MSFNSVMGLIFLRNNVVWDVVILFKEGALRSNSVLWCTHFPIESLWKWTKVYYLTLKWCKMPLYLIPFQCEFFNIQKHPVRHIIWVCTFLYRDFFSSFLNLHDIQSKRRWLWLFHERKIPVWNVKTHLLLTSNDVMFQISHWKSIK